MTTSYDPGSPPRLKYKSIDPSRVPKTASDSGARFPAVVTAHSYIGGIASTWGAFEQVLDDTLWDFTGVDHRFGACLTSQMGSSYNKLIALEAVLRLHQAPEAILKELNRITKKWDGLNRDRNRSVHDPINIDEKGNVFVRRIHTGRNTNGLVYTYEPFDFAWYEKAKFSMLSFYNQFIAFKERAVASLSSESP